MWNSAVSGNKLGGTYEDDARTQLHFNVIVI